MDELVKLIWDLLTTNERFWFETDPQLQEVFKSGIEDVRNKKCTEDDLVLDLVQTLTMNNYYQIIS
jgi:hypothetical protein